MPPALLRAFRPLAAAVPVLLAAACGPAPETTLDPETFVEVYAELRIAALEQDDATLTLEDRERILARHGITEEDLLAFARVHGDDPAYMLAVWEAVEARLNVDPAAPPAPDSAS